METNPTHDATFWPNGILKSKDDALILRLHRKTHPKVSQSNGSSFNLLLLGVGLSGVGHLAVPCIVLYVGTLRSCVPLPMCRSPKSGTPKNEPHKHDFASSGRSGQGHQQSGK